MNHTTQFLTEAAARPDDALALTECPEEVRAELESEAISAGSFLMLLPQILALVRLITSNGATIAEAWAAIRELIKALRPA